MAIWQILVLLHLLAVPAFAQTQPFKDYWGAFGAYGPCSRSCGTGLAMKTRTCITSRIDGGHNCVGSSKSFRTCNTQECPVGSKDFREQQCSEFDKKDFQGKHHTWVPYHAATNPCELNCMPRGQNFFYRHKAAVVDGTPCYVGRTDICVDGVCRLLTHAEFMGLDNETSSTANIAIARHPREAFTYAYRTGPFCECSASCNGGMQYRTVECVLQNPSNPRVVDESHCIARRLQRPPSQQACNMHPCTTAEYSVSSFSVCSVTCGEGQQSREVYCIGASGERLPDQACRGLARPPSVKACRKPACHTRISWHVTQYGLCSKSCSGGIRERRVGCFDTDLNPYAEERCGLATKPTAVESCNMQPCHRPQMVPSVQNPGGGSPIKGFVPHVPGQPTDPNSVHSPHCAQSPHGCCPDGKTPATGPGNRGCAPHDCVRSRYGCCLDGVTPALGFGRVGCPDYQPDHDNNAVGPSRETFKYVYRTGEFTPCSAPCNGGVQRRAVGCFVQDPRNSRAVDESFCVAQGLQRPHSEQACNTQPCFAEYSVSSFGECSVTCGEGQQIREVYCIGASGERLPDQACRGLARPPSVKACRKPACHTRVFWHVSEFGSCSRSCGSGIRERRVSCVDTNLNPYPEDRCGLATKPTAVESCNMQPCRGPQPPVEKGPSPPVRGPPCAQSPYGCCPDGHTPAAGPENFGCAPRQCSHTRFGCCSDGVTPAKGARRAGCPETTDHHVDHTSSDACFLPRDEGPCDTWTVRFSYDSRKGKCTEFWFGGCHGNANNFKTMDACHRVCGNVRKESSSASHGRRP